MRSPPSRGVSSSLYTLTRGLAGSRGSTCGLASASSTARTGKAPLTSALTSCAYVSELRMSPSRLACLRAVSPIPGIGRPIPVNRMLTNRSSAFLVHALIGGIRRCHNNYRHSGHSVATAHCRAYPAESSARFAQHQKYLQLLHVATRRPQSAASIIGYN